MRQFDVIVVGGGHAGVEAAHAAARMGAQTLLVTLDKDKIGHMPCNPAIGGVGKGHIVFDISALGGLMPKLCTTTYLQARMLNTRKGPAVQGLRLQIDKHAYSKRARIELENTANLTIYADTVETVLRDDQGCVYGLQTSDGSVFHTPSVVLTTGTFLNGLMHIGDQKISGGRRDEKAVTGLSTFLISTGLKLGRLKTGTPPRLLRSSLDFSVMTYQEPDDLSHLFEFEPVKVQSTHPCYITHTNERTHEVIKNNLHRSAMYSGAITGVGPRYCPSIEDKIGRFPDKMSHHIFVEPEGEGDESIYPNGISTSLPLEVQEQYIRTVVGFENAIITKPGYAVEYDFVLPNQLHHTLEVKTVPGLFLAGQINGTTGYEEAAGQGIMAGINAALKAHNKDPFILSRTESYIGIMIDDLVTMGVDEPYRMFTSRAEQRLILRQDNAFARLTPKGYALGIVDKVLYNQVMEEQEQIQKAITLLRGHKQHSAEFFRILENVMDPITAIKERTGLELSDRAARTVQAEIQYGPYMEREQKEAQRLETYQTLKLPTEIVYTGMAGLSKELQQKLTRIKPATIAQAGLIPGMTPAALSLLIIKVRKKQS